MQSRSHEGDENTPVLGDAALLLAKSLSKSETLVHLQHIADTVEFLLGNHAVPSLQACVESVLSSIATTCSPNGPKIGSSKAAGQIFHRMCRLLRVIIERHRLRLEGRFHIVVTTLNSLLRVLLTDPFRDAANRSTTASCPPWLHSPLHHRHTARFVRLVTLICEPSAASVARSQAQTLDSLVDASKRSAGEYMYCVVMQYIKLQLSGHVSRDVRQALKPAIYSVLNITTEAGRRTLNESLDAEGRAIFRETYSDYRRFGKWTGV